MNPESIPTYKLEEVITVGYWGYKVADYEWRNSIGSEYLRHRPNAKYLRITIGCVNGDKSASSLPPFKLLDDEGREYQQSHDGWSTDGYFGVLETLNPMVSKAGYILYDVQPKDYWLELSGGYLSSAKARLRISTKRPKPRA